MIVKICGMTSSEMAQVVSQSGADWIGFVFAPSRRQISPEDAKDIVRRLPANLKKVGVFVNERVERMIEIADHVGLDMIQLHGDETPDVARQLPFKTIKAFSIDDERISLANEFPSDYILLDSPAEKYRGGTGKTFDWTSIHHLNIDPNKLVLAGGLTPDNVAQAIATVRPAGVDVSSGVETNQQKDPEKIKRFLRQAKG